MTSIKQSLLGIQVSNANYAIEILSNEEERFIFARVTLIFLVEVEGDLWKDHVLLIQIYFIFKVGLLPSTETAG